VILFCGGYTSGHVAEAEEMAVMAMALGVPRRAILVENASISTSQNAAFAEPLLKKRGFRSALLVTHKEHMDRAFKEFKEIKQLRRLERGYADDAVPDPLSVEFDRALPAADQFQAVVLHTRSGWLEPGADPLVLQGPQVEVAKGAAFLYRSGLTAVPYFVWHDAFAVGHVTRAEMVGLAAIAYGMPASALEYASARRYSKEGLELFDTCLARGWKSVLAVIPAERAGDVADIERQYLEHGISAFVLVVK
jgi:hypothetical protein